MNYPNLVTKTVKIQELSGFPTILGTLNRIANKVCEAGSLAYDFEHDDRSDYLLYPGMTLKYENCKYQNLIANPIDLVLINQDKGLSKFPWRLYGPGDDYYSHDQDEFRDEYAFAFEAHIQIEEGLLCLSFK